MKSIGTMKGISEPISKQINGRIAEAISAGFFKRIIWDTSEGSPIEI